MQAEHSNDRLVLVAERDAHVRDLQSHFLERAGFSVEFVDDGCAAFTRAQSANPACVVAEILIPKMDGLTLCRRLRSDPATRDVPVLVFSILAAGARATEAGASEFLRKPLIEATFLAAIDRVIAARAHPTLEQQ